MNRKREDIEKDFNNKGYVEERNQQLILEVLLDIRDGLKRRKG